MLHSHICPWINGCFLNVQCWLGAWLKFVILPTSLHWIKIRISQTLEEGPGVWALNFFLFSSLFFSFASRCWCTHFSQPLSSHSHFPFRGGKKNWRKVSASLRLNPQTCLTLDKERNYFHFHPSQPRILQDRRELQWRCRETKAHPMFNIYKIFIVGRLSGHITWTLRLV